MTLNVGGSAILTGAENTNNKFRGGITLNYNSTATSTSDMRLSINNSTAELNINNGALEVKTFTSKNGGLLYLNGGDFSFKVPDVSLNTFTVGSINFKFDHGVDSELCGSSRCECFG